MPRPASSPPLALRVLFPVALMSFGTIFGLLAAEIVLRIAWNPPGAPGMYCQDRTLGRTLCPNWVGTIRGSEYQYTIHTDSTGMRSPEPTEDDSPRVLGLGDSFAFGQGVQDNEMFYAVARERLSKTFPKAAIYNAACPSWGSAQQVEVAKSRIGTLKPDVVVIAFYSGNDLFDTLLFHDPRAKAQREKLAHGQAFAETMPWRKKIRLYRFFTDALVPMLPAPLRDFLIGQRELWLGVASHAGKEWSLFSVNRDEEVERGWKEVANSFNQLKTLAKNHNAKLAALYIPTDAEVRPNRWQAILEQTGQAPETLDVSLPRSRFLKMCDALGVSVIDPGEALQKSEKEPYFRIDRHLNVHGHRLVGEKLHEFLQRELAPSEP